MEIAEFVAKHGITMEIDGGIDPNTLRAKRIVKDADGWAHYDWTCTLVRANEQMTVPYHTGTGIVSRPARMTESYLHPREVAAIPKPPTAEDVLDSLANESSGYENVRGFEDWCADYGYDTDSRKAESIYRVVAEQAKALRFLLGSEAYEELLRDVERM